MGGGVKVGREPINWKSNLENWQKCLNSKEVTLEELL